MNTLQAHKAASEALTQGQLRLMDAIYTEGLNGVDECTLEVKRLQYEVDTCAIALSNANNH